MLSWPPGGATLHVIGGGEGVENENVVNRALSEFSSPPPPGVFEVVDGKATRAHLPTCLPETTLHHNELQNSQRPRPLPLFRDLFFAGWYWRAPSLERAPDSWQGIPDQASYCQICVENFHGLRGRQW